MDRAHAANRVENPPEQPVGAEGGTLTSMPGAILVPIDLVDRDPDQVRRDWRHDDGYAHLEELTRSIKEFGLLQPPVVRRAAERYMVIAGGRRLVAARRAGLTRISVVVRDEEGAHARVLQLIENVQRQQLAPLDEARAYQELMEIEGLTTGGVAARVHVSTQTVRDKLRLLRHQVLADAVERRQLSATAAREINKLPDEVAEDMRRRVQAGEKFQISDIQEIRAQLQAAGVVNPRWNPRPSEVGTELPLSPAEPPVRPATAALPLFYDSSLLPRSAEPSTQRDEQTAPPAHTESRLPKQHQAERIALAASTWSVAPMEEEGSAHTALNRAMAEPKSGPSLQQLVAQVPWPQTEALLEYGVACGWSCAGLLHMARTMQAESMTPG